jgi:hypothetical protein
MRAALFVKRRVCPAYSEPGAALRSALRLSGVIKKMEKG